MPDLPEFLKRDAVLFMHDQTLKEYGGTRGLKSQNLLQSALAHAENRWYYDEAPRPDAAIMAATYAYGTARNRPFSDANNRTTWSCCILFLRLHGTRVQVSVPDAVEVMVALVSGTMEHSWLRRRSPND